MQALAERGLGLLDSIAEFCRASGIAESKFGRRAVNDGKFVSRLRDGARTVLRSHGGLWFLDESYVVSRRRG